MLRWSRCQGYKKVLSQHCHRHISITVIFFVTVLMAFQYLYESQGPTPHLITKHGAILSRIPTVSHSFKSWCNVSQCHGEMFPHYVVAVCVYVPPGWHQLLWCHSDVIVGPALSLVACELEQWPLPPVPVSLTIKGDIAQHVRVRNQPFRNINTR